MKNLLIVAVLLVGGFLAYTFFGQPSDDPTSLPAETSSAVDSLSSTAPENATIAISYPLDGAVITSPLTVKFAISNMQLAPAGNDLPDSGHHHLLIDMDELPDLTKPLPATPQLMHFGGGQTEATIELTPGMHTLQLVLGNYLHIPHKTPIVSNKITVRVRTASPLTM